MTNVWPLLLGVTLDRLLGEPRAWHPLVAFGRYANRLESTLNRSRSTWARQLMGALAWTIAVLPPVVLCVLCRRLLQAWLVDALALYFVLGARSLAEHARAVGEPLAAGNLGQARTALSNIVSRDTGDLDATEVASAAVESVLENGNDAIFGALFWFAILGAPGALLFRLANTLDAMWGYRTPRFHSFGWMAARSDDALNWIPARLTAFTYALAGRTRQAIACWHLQARAWDSPNAGPVMAAGAGALGVHLGGPAPYHGVLEDRPKLGCGARPGPSDIGRALALVRASYLIWIVLLSSACLALGAFHG